jgi:hypothetical protein
MEITVDTFFSFLSQTNGSSGLDRFFFRINDRIDLMMLALLSLLGTRRTPDRTAKHFEL